MHACHRLQMTTPLRPAPRPNQGAGGRRREPGGVVVDPSEIARIRGSCHYHFLNSVHDCTTLTLLRVIHLSYIIRPISSGMSAPFLRRRQLAEWRTGVCETNGIRMSYTRTGGGKPPLILLHGLTANGLCWTAVAHELEGEYDAIMPDLRGHGKSSAPEHGYRYEDHANDVVGLIKGLGISAPILIGHSMGGLVAAVVASHDPALIRGLILADPTFISSRRQREVRDSDVADQHRRVLNSSLEEVVRDLRMKHAHRDSATVERIAKARLETRMSAFDVLTPPNPEYRQLLRSIDVPGLLVIADAGVVSADVASELQLVNPKLQVAQIEDAGHGIFYDQPDRFSAVVKSFLHSIDE